MAIHIWHHFDADGFCAAAVVRGFLNIENDFLKEHDKYNPIMQVLNHSYPMKWNNVSDGDVIFIVDYSFTRNDDVAEILSRMDKVRFIWIDHHVSSIKLIEEQPELEELAKEGLIYTDSPKLSGCYLAYIYMLWNYSAENREIHICKDDVCELKDKLPVPDFVRLVSDYDTFSHSCENSVEFVKALEFVGLKNCFYNDSVYFKLGNVKYVSFDICLETKLMTSKNSYLSMSLSMSDEYTWISETYDSFVKSKSSTVVMRKVLITERSVIQSLIEKGKAIVDIMKVYDAKDVKSKAFESIIRVPTLENTEKYRTFKLLVLNKMGNSQMFGDAYNVYDGVVTMIFNGEQFTYSIFSHERSELNCELVGTYFKKVFGITGGGHTHAAGFSALSPVFMKNAISVLDTDAYRILRNDGSGPVTVVGFADENGTITVEQHIDDFK